MRFLPQNYYHVYNRGNDRQRIFLEAENYRFFLCRLRDYLIKGDSELVAYCLIPNHFHLIVYLEDCLDFSNVLRRFTSCYVKSINKRYGRVGYLFQGNTRSKLIDTEEYLFHLCRYIHLNPVAAGLVVSPEEWKYSDYREWISDSLEADSPIRRTRGAYVSSGEGYERFVKDYAAAERVREEIESKLSERPCRSPSSTDERSM